MNDTSIPKFKDVITLHEEDDMVDVRQAGSVDISSKGATKHQDWRKASES